MTPEQLRDLEIRAEEWDSDANDVRALIGEVRRLTALNTNLHEILANEAARVGVLEGALRELIDTIERLSRCFDCDSHPGQVSEHYKGCSVLAARSVLDHKETPR